MPLAPGQSLTHYQILAPIGAGGMGEVYRARDTRLERDVAIKVLPVELAHDAERLRRFEREAKTLASLNHPNVAGIHGLDQVDDVCFLALELVPGEDLGERLKRGAMPIDEALDVCRQIAEGLEAAHEAGVVHRDLKPANVRLTPEGVAKVLDFGLAKPLHPKPGREGTSTAESDSFVMTEEGRVLGTPTYMSPEQARGKPVDRRTDLWAFGCVLYECLAGKRAFGGNSFPDIVAAIVGQEPDWNALPPLAPRVKELLQRCLTKDPRARLRDAGEARVQLQLALAAPGRGAEAAATIAAQVGDAKRTRSSALLAGALGLAAGAALVFGIRPMSGDAKEVTASSTPLHFTFEELPSTSAVDIAISPDGATVAWTQVDGLHVRSLGSLTGKILVESGAGVEAQKKAPSLLTWSPDSREIAYMADDVLWRIPSTGGAPTRISEEVAPITWTADGKLVVVDLESRIIIGSIPAHGGNFVPQLEADPKTTRHFDAWASLPDGSLLVLRHRVAAIHADVLALARDGVLRDLVQLTDWEIGEIDYGAGHIVFLRTEGAQKSLWKVGFSLESGEILGEPTLLTAGTSPFSISTDGTLAYQRVEGEQAVESVWVDKQGVIEPFGRKHEGDVMVSAASQDGRRVFTAGFGSDHTIWAYDLDRGVTTAVVKPKDRFLVSGLTLADGRILGWRPLPDQTVAFPLDGRGEPEQITEGWLTAISRDGAFGLLGSGVTTDSLRLEALHMADRVVTPFRDVKLNWQMIPSITPDGRFALYGSERTGDKQIYLAPFPSGSGDWQVSTDGAIAAWFNATGDTIYLQRGGIQDVGPLEVWRVTLQSEPEVRLGAPEHLFTVEGEQMALTGYHPTQDRFLGFRRVSSGTSSIAIHSGWAEPR